MRLSKEQLLKLIQKTDCVMVDAEMYGRQSLLDDVYTIAREDEELIHELEFSLDVLLAGEVGERGTLKLEIHEGDETVTLLLQFLELTPVNLSEL